MKFEGEHLLIGKIGHFFVLLAFVTSLLSTIGFFIAAKKIELLEKASWVKFGRINFYIQTIAVFTIFACIFYICSNHYIEYLYGYKHTSKELEFKYLLACIWEDQSGSFLLWTIWHCVIGIFLISKAKEWEAPVMTVVSAAQVFLAMMIMGVYFGSIKIGNSPFVLTRNEINGPVFEMADYLAKIKDGVGLNVLLRNYWMVIHPPILFLGFASTIVPFAFAYAGLQTKRFGDWVKPAIPYTLFSVCTLGVGIMMGGKWAYESLSFGGYWAWDPVENASLVPWLILIAGLHTMVIYNATKHSLRASFVFALLGFLFVLYSTFLTRTGILGDTSVHAFTEAGKAMNILIFSFLIFFLIASTILYIVNHKKIPFIIKEESSSSREFWMFIGSLVFFLSALFISAKTSTPVINSIFNTKLAPPEDVEFSYNKVMVLVAIIVGLLTAITQYLKYKNTEASFWVKKIAIPTAAAIIVLVLLVVFYPITYQKQGPGFLGAIYVALFATLYSVFANAAYIWIGLKGKLQSAGGAVAHLGFALMIVGMLISAGNKKVISEEKYKAFSLPTMIDPLTKKQDNPAENINLIKQVPARMGEYQVSYLHDSVGKETGRRYYKLLFERKDESTKEVVESFMLNPDVYLMKDNNMSSNPDTKNYLTHDVFTYISYALNPEKNKDTGSFRINEYSIGDTIFYGKGFMILDSIVKNPTINKYGVQLTGPAVLASLTVYGKDSMRYQAKPILSVETVTAKSIDSLGINDAESFNIRQIDDTVYAQNLFVQFAGIGTDTKKIKIGVKESDTMIDFVTLKAYIFPYINLVWLGLILMAIGFTISINQRAKLPTVARVATLLFVAISLFYMFLMAG
jgi:cytochrome c-type biogenesis protein CcmF